MTIERVKIGNTGFKPAKSDGHGATGEIKKSSWLEKKASWLGKSVEVGGENLNKGSLIDFLNSQTPQGQEKLKKGFLGFGGDSNEKVQKKFNEMFPTLQKTEKKSDMTTPKTQSEPFQIDYKKMADLPEGSSPQFVYEKESVIKKMGGKCLTDKNELSTFQKGQSFYIGIVLYNNTLVLCPGGGNMEFEKEDYDRLMPKVFAKLQELNINPTHVAVSGRHPGETLEAFRQWHRDKSNET